MQHLKFIVKKTVISCLLYPLVEEQEKIIVIYSEKEQVTYLENASNYKHRLEPDYQVMLEHIPRWQFQTD